MHWSQVAAFLEGKCEEYVSGNGRKPKNGYARGFVLPSGLQLAIETNSDGDRTNVWIEDCGPPPLPSQFQLYRENKSRTSALSSVAPRLSGPGYGKAPQRAYKILVKGNRELVALFDWYSGLDGRQTSQEGTDEVISVKVDNVETADSPLNRILFGPPGTGKTYKTAELAVEICDGNADMPREQLMARYEVLSKEGRINFVTFHQSYSYEDFVEGLRPESKDGQISYHVRRGIFREACDAARLRRMVQPGLTGKPLKDRTIYKMSLGRSGSVEGKQALQACLENGYVVLGWGADVDFSECRNADDIRRKIEEEIPSVDKRDSHIRFVTLFKDELKNGDLVIVSQGNSAFRAIGEVSGDYQFLETPAAGSFFQMRRVRWLAVFDENRPVSEIYNKSFMMSALNKLDVEGLKFDALAALITREQMGSPQNYVLIIDEINRANISKVFGELITLLEPDKREGSTNALTVKLPYSGDSFSVPSNLYVVGTMNTADRSIALLDTALRRRFDFEELRPDYDALPEDSIDGVELRPMLQAINERIDYLYDRDHTIGHAYLIGVRSLEGLDSTFRRRIIPLLQEYFYEDWSKIRLVLNDLAGYFIETKEGVPKGLESTMDNFESRPRYKVNDKSFPLDAYLNIYQ